ncbi:MAG: hypothetical protein HQ528_11260 [Candidatus Marinimicrobia bacterium]|nr:hypothetical protein [Candidatus Neomarinimicrobiota bacterium]
MKRIIIISIMTLSIMLISNCENYEDEDFVISEFDQQACQLISADDSTKIVVVPYIVVDTTLTTLDSIYTKVQAMGKEIYTNADSAWQINFTGLGADTAYFIYEHNSVSNSVTFFFDKYLGTEISFDLFESDGILLFVADQSISLETIAACELLATRNQYELDAGSYLFRVTKNVGSVKKITAAILAEG